MPATKPRKPKTQAKPVDPNASLVDRIGRLPYRPTLKIADMRKAVKYAREQRLLRESQESSS